MQIVSMMNVMHQVYAMTHARCIQKMMSVHVVSVIHNFDEYEDCPYFVDRRIDNEI